MRFLYWSLHYLANRFQSIDEREKLWIFEKPDDIQNPILTTTIATPIDIVTTRSPIPTRIPIVVPSTKQASTIPTTTPSTTPTTTPTTIPTTTPTTLPTTTPSTTHIEKSTKEEISYLNSKSVNEKITQNISPSSFTILDTR